MTTEELNAAVAEKIATTEAVHALGLPDVERNWCGDWNAAMVVRDIMGSLDGPTWDTFTGVLRRLACERVHRPWLDHINVWRHAQPEDVCRAAIEATDRLAAQRAA